MKERIEHDFTHHPPRGPGDVEDHEHVRSMIKGVALGLDRVIPDSREKSLAVTKLEEAMFWANAALARNRTPEDAS